MTKTFYLSFADDDGFRGGCFVDVTDEDAAACRPRLLPQSQPGAEWLLAAVRAAHLHGCNPGGGVMCAEIPPDKLAQLPHAFERYRLYTEAELQARQPKTH